MYVLKRLIDVLPGTQVEILDIRANLELCKRLAELSFVPGEQLYVVASNPKAYVVVESNRGRFGIPKEIAEKIYVREIFAQPIQRRRRHRGRRWWWR